MDLFDHTMQLLYPKKFLQNCDWQGGGDTDKLDTPQTAASDAVSEFATFLVNNNMKWGIIQWSWYESEGMGFF